jgi:hypothetical protein
MNGEKVRIRKETVEAYVSVLPWNLHERLWNAVASIGPAEIQKTHSDTTTSMYSVPQSMHMKCQRQAHYFNQKYIHTYIHTHTHITMTINVSIIIFPKIKRPEREAY